MAAEHWKQKVILFCSKRWPFTSYNYSDGQLELLLAIFSINNSSNAKPKVTGSPLGLKVDSLQYMHLANLSTYVDLINTMVSPVIVSADKRISR